MLTPDGADLVRIRRHLDSLSAANSPDEALRALLSLFAEALDDAVSRGDDETAQMAVRDIIAVARVAHARPARFPAPGSLAPEVDPSDCPHERAFVEATLGGEAALSWVPLNPSRGDWGDLRGHVSAGTCTGCGVRVATVRAWNGATWTPGRGPVWSTPWTRLVLDGGGAAS